MQPEEKRADTAAADAASEQLRQFLYAASHDLQEPLRAIVAYAQLLHRHFVDDAAAQEYLPFILQGANRMKELLQNMLVYSRAGCAKNRRPLSLDAPLARALLKLSPEIKAADARIVRHPLPEAVADEGEIALVFENLLRNSLCFRSTTPPEIIISAEQGTDEATITLRDNGLGIDPQFCAEALLPFKRLHGKDLSASGLGLAICEKIIRAHAGRLWLESDGSTGTVAHFTLPL